VTPATFVHDCRDPQSGREYRLTLPSGDPVDVAARNGRLLIDIQQRFTLREVDDPDTGPWKTSTAKYRYTIYRPDQREVLAFHWHPGREAYDRPHLHVGHGAGALIPALRAAHIPTGRVSVEDFILLAIREFGVRARRGDHVRVLEASRERFERFKTW
jgi:hypothetical protein